MALEMKVHKDLAAVQPKPMMGMTWRQLFALVVMIIGGGGVFAGVTALVLASSGGSWQDPQALKQATTAGFYVMMPIVFPVAMWAWWRPLGLKPEDFAPYMFRHRLMSREFPYEDSFAHRTARAVDEREPVPSRTGIGRLVDVWERVTAGALASRRRGDVSEHDRG